MSIILLAAQPFAKTQAGAELFSNHLMDSIKEITTIFPPENKIPKWPYLIEPAKSKAVADELQSRLAELKPTAVMYNGMYGWALPKNTPYKKIALCHGTYPSFARHALPWSLDRIRTQFIYSFFERKSFENADIVISNSAYTRECLKKEYGINSQVIPLATTSHAVGENKKRTLRKEISLPQNKKIILFAGRATYSKGFDWVEKLAATHPEWYFVSVTSPRAHSQNIDCRGPFLFEELQKYYNACDAVIYPSRVESFGYVTIEALAAHKPVVTSNFGIAREISHPYCIKIDSPSLEAFADGINRALQLESDKTLANEMKRFEMKRFTADYKKMLGLKS